MRTSICVLCNHSIAARAVSTHWVSGNNAAPLAQVQCCDPCNDKVVAYRVLLSISQARNLPNGPLEQPTG